VGPVNWGAAIVVAGTIIIGAGIIKTIRRKK
jgi:hypothetical protein